MAGQSEAPVLVFTEACNDVVGYRDASPLPSDSNYLHKAFRTRNMLEFIEEVIQGELENEESESRTSVREYFLLTITNCTSAQLKRASTTPINGFKKGTCRLRCTSPDGRVHPSVPTEHLEAVGLLPDSVICEDVQNSQPARLLRPDAESARLLRRRPAYGGRRLRESTGVSLRSPLVPRKSRKRIQVGSSLVISSHVERTLTYRIAMPHKLPWEYQKVPP